MKKRFVGNGVNIVEKRTEGDDQIRVDQESAFKPDIVPTQEPGVLVVNNEKRNIQKEKELEAPQRPSSVMRYKKQLTEDSSLNAQPLDVSKQDSDNVDEVVASPDVKQDGKHKEY